MKRIIGTGMLGGLAFAALSLATDRNAEACNGEPPEPPEPCAYDYDEETSELTVVKPVVSIATGPQEDECGCGLGFEVPENAEVVAAGFVGPDGRLPDQFCASVFSPGTQTAFNTLFGRTFSASVFAGVSLAGTTGGQPGWAWSRIANIGADEFPSSVALGKINIIDGVETVDPKHNLHTDLARAECTNCDENPTSVACTVIATINNTGGEPADPTAAANPARVCINKDATELIARARGLDVDGGGCNVSRGGASAAAGFLAVLGAAFAFGRTRRRRRA